MPIATNRKTLRLAAMLLITGAILSLGVGFLHPDREDPNDHPAVFAEYAESTEWTPVHLGQFVGMAAIVAGLLAMYEALNLPSGPPGMAGRLGAASAIINLGIYGVLQAVDGVALKRAVVAWVSAPEAEKTARFASAQAIRWLEEAVRSYQDFMLGSTLLLLAILILWKSSIPRAVGLLFGLAGCFYLAQGWILGQEGFSANHGQVQLPAYVFLITGIIWLSISAWKMKDAAGAHPRT